MGKKNIFEKNPKKTIILFLVVAFLVTDVVSKNILKTYFKIVLRTNNHEKEYRIPSNTYHHDLKKNIFFEKTAWGNVFYAVATNSLGFKDRHPREVPLDSKEYRILVIGDSFAEGIGVEYDKTFVGMIDSSLKSKDIRVLNAAAASYCPSIYYAKTKYLIDVVGLDFDRLIVFLDISDISDEVSRYKLVADTVIEDDEALRRYSKREEEFYANKKRKRSIYQRIEQALYRDSIVSYRLCKKMHDMFFPRPLTYDYDSLELYGSSWTFNKYLYENFGKEGLSKARHAMDLLNSLCFENGVQMTLAVYPHPDQIAANDLNSIHVQYWSNWANTHDVDFINMFPDFIPKSSTDNEVKRIIDKYFIPGDVHWNYAGHQKVAKHLLEKLPSILDQE